MGKYIQRIRETTKAAREADEKLQHTTFAARKSSLTRNEKCGSSDAQRRAGLARTSP